MRILLPNESSCSSCFNPAASDSLPLIILHWTLNTYLYLSISIYLTEYPEVEGTHKHHQIPLLALHKIVGILSCFQTNGTAPQGTSGHCCVFHVAAEAPWPNNFVFLQGQGPCCDAAGRVGLELLGFQFLALNPREREVCWCRIILDYVTLQQGAVSELTKETQAPGKAESQRVFPTFRVPG